MSNKIIGLVMFTGIATVICGICEQQYFGEAEASRLTILLTSPSFGESLGIFGTITAVVDFTWSWFVNLLGMMFFDYSFFQGQWQIVRYILFIPIGIGIISSIVAMIRGTSA